MAIIFPGGSLAGPTKCLKVHHKDKYSGTDSSSSTNFTIFNKSVTPVAAGSKFEISFNIFASHTSGQNVYMQLEVNGSYTTYGRNDASSSNASASESNNFPSYGSDHWNNAAYSGFNGSYLYAHSGSSAFNVVVRHRNQGGTTYYNRSYSYDDGSRGKPASWLTVIEYAA